MSTKSTNTNKLRIISRLAVMVIAVALGMRWFAGSFTKFPLAPEAFLPALSPFIGVASAICNRSIHVAMLIWLPVAMLSLLFGRWFCRNLCFLGLLTDLIGKIRSTKNAYRKAPDNAVTVKEECVVGASIDGVPKATASDPLSANPPETVHSMESLAHNPPKRGRRLRVPRLGPVLVMVALSSAIAGYPLFLWLDPLSIFNGFLAAWHQPLVLTNVLSAGGFLLVVLLSFISPGSWCYRVCPLGFSQDLLRYAGRWLRGLTTPRDKRAAVSKTQVTRRSFLAAAAGATAGGLVSRRRLGAAQQVVIRPPGVTEKRFSSLCVRCGNCTSACPQGIIHQDPGGTGFLSFLTPVVKISPGYCSEDCNACGNACPTGAIAPLSDDKRNVAIGFAEVIHKTCIRCMLCIIECPYNAISSEYIYGRYYPVVYPDVCRGCGLCEVICPVNDKAIVIRGVPQRTLSPVDLDYPVDADDSWME